MRYVILDFFSVNARQTDFKISDYNYMIIGYFLNTKDYYNLFI